MDPHIARCRQVRTATTARSRTCTHCPPTCQSRSQTSKIPAFGEGIRRKYGPRKQKYGPGARARYERSASDPEAFPSTCPVRIAQQPRRITRTRRPWGARNLASHTIAKCARISIQPNRSHRIASETPCLPRKPRRPTCFLVSAMECSQGAVWGGPLRVT